MKTSTINNQDERFCRLYRTGYISILTLLILLTTIVQQLRADTITIGKGTGIIWEGMPFNATLSGTMHMPSLEPDTGYAILSISNDNSKCLSTNNLDIIGSYKALKIAPGVGLVPRASGYAQYRLYDNITTERLDATIGLPNSSGSAANINSTFEVSSPNGYEWCLTPRMQRDNYFYDSNYNRTANISGNWVLVADGSQVTSEIQLNPMYFGSYSSSINGDLYTSILPPNITLRISTLECIVSTPTMVNFGNVERLTSAGSEIATYDADLITTCLQGEESIDANINVKFRALSGLYSNEPTRLALTQGGGYITGEIYNVTGSGSCASTNGLPFDGSKVKIGNILASEFNKSIRNILTWRLCSGGSSLPYGYVNASAEMLVTFN